MQLTFRAKLLAAFLATVLFAELLTVAALDRSVSAELTSQLGKRLEDQARGATEWVAVGRHPDEISKRLGKIVAARVTVFDARGRIVGDSSDNAPSMEPAATEVREAQQAGNAVARATRDDVLYVAVPTDGGLVVRLGSPLTDVYSTLWLMRQRLLAASALVFALAVVLALLAARLLGRPLLAMRDAARKIAEGQFHVELGPFPNDELGSLARSLQSMAAQLEARLGELQRMDALRRQFLDDMTHEIATPVAAIQGYAETLVAGKGDAAEAREFLEVIERHARRIGRLVQDLRFLAALEAHSEEQQPLVEPVPLLETVGYVLETVRQRAEERKANIVLDISDELHVLGDPDHVERVLLNLIDNAVKYGKDTGGTVKVSARTVGDRVTIVVVDDGPGVAAEHLPRLFERFYRVDKGRSRDRGGTGLGLAIVKQLAEAMGGSASAASDGEGHGVAFAVVLPKAAAAAAPPVASS